MSPSTEFSRRRLWCGRDCVVTPVFPLWLTAVSETSVALALGCAALIAVDEVRRPQAMGIMNLVWPLASLFGSLVWRAFYARWGRTRPRGVRPAPMAVAVAKGASHCGAGCALGDLVGEGCALAFPPIAVAFGWPWLFADRMFAVWLLDFVLAFFIGVAFQYLALRPTGEVSLLEGLIQALKADAASIAAWQVGMFGFMGIAQFLWFRPAYGGVASAATPEFWFAMQMAMFCGFATAYPVNWMLVKAGVKERM